MASLPIPLCSPPSSGEEFGDYDYYDKVREKVARLVESGEVSVENPSVIPVGLSPCLAVDDAATSNLFRNVATPTSSSTTTTIHLRHLTLFMPLTIPPAFGPSPYPRDALDVTAAILVAVHEWNNGLGDVMPEVAKVSRQCPVKFTIDIVDSRYSNQLSVKLLWEQVVKRRDKENDPADTPEEAQRVKEPGSTAVVIGNLSRDTGAVSVLASATVTPMFSLIAQSTDFDNQDQYPYFGRTVPSFSVTTVMLAEFFKNELHSSHVAILHQKDAYGWSLLTEVREACKELDVKITSASFATNRDLLIAVKNEGVAGQQRVLQEDYASLRHVCENFGLRHYFMIMYDDVAYRVVKTAAENFGGSCTGAGTFWLKGDTFAFPWGTYEAGSPMAEALKYMGTLSFPRSPQEVFDRPSYDAFVSKYWPDGLRQDANFAKYIQHKMPSTLAEAGHPNLTSVPYSDLVNPYALPAYDLITAVALSACDVEGKRAEGDPLDTNGSSLYKSFLKQMFDGLSGTVTFSKSTGARVQGSFPYVINNVLPNEPVNGNLTFERKPVYIFQEATENETSRWSLLDEDTPFIFSDGTTVPPLTYPALETKYLAVHPVTAMFCGLLATVVVLTSLGFVNWTLRSSRSGCRVVQASQPVFLYILCAGTFIMASAIIPLSIAFVARVPSDDDDGDEDFDVDEPGLNVACMATPWLFSLGFLMTFSSLFTKLMRINKIFGAGSFRRSKVLARDVSRPFAIFLFVQIVILVAWTAVSPLQYRLVKTGATDRFGRFTERYPACYPPLRMEHFKDHIFWMLLLLLNFGAVLWANLEAYRARNVPSQYSESNYIAWAMLSILQAFLIGGPMLAVARGETNAMLVTSSLFVVILSLAILLLLFLPKRQFQKDGDSMAPQNSDRVRRRDENMSSWRTSLNSDNSSNRMQLSSRRWSGD